MKDDGLSEDDNANDGTYGVKIATTSSNLDYYIYAENDSSGAFLPTNAAYNFYSIRKEKSVVVNEICALNSTIISDENNEFEDWIELYNTTQNSVDLTGYYLSDDIDELNKWAFPTISIDADGYLLVWADKDDDGSMHANFKLSSGGEAVYLSYNGEIVDQISFGGQAEDITYGRSPNGTGSFALMEPTPNAFNSGRRVGVNSFSRLEANVYPNPANGKVIVNAEKNSKLLLLNMQGELLLNTQVRAGANSLDLSEMASGIYYITLIDEESSTTKKLLKL